MRFAGAVFFGWQPEQFRKNGGECSFYDSTKLPLLQDYAVGEFKENPLSHIMFDCLMDPHHLLSVLGKNFSSVLQ